MITTKSGEGKMLDFVPPEWDNIRMENTPESAAPAGMTYWRAYFYFFDSPKWTMNLLLGAVCNLIPVLGGIVFAGYGYEAVEAMHRRGKDDQYPEFDFNRFVKYLVRGCWPFIWQLIVGLPFAFIMWFFYMVLIMAFIGTADHEGPKPGVLVPVLILFVLMGLILGVIVGVMLAPLVLRAGLSQKLGFGEALPFMQDFLKRMGKEVVLAQLFLVGTAIVIMPIAYALCVLPAFPAAVIIQMAHFHLLYQLYGLYLKRGGTAVPLQVEALPT
jgi:hypothetical protein